MNIYMNKIHLWEGRGNRGRSLDGHVICRKSEFWDAGFVYFPVREGPALASGRKRPSLIPLGRKTGMRNENAAASEIQTKPENQKNKKNSDWSSAKVGSDPVLSRKLLDCFVGARYFVN